MNSIPRARDEVTGDRQASGSAATRKPRARCHHVATVTAALAFAFAASQASDASACPAPLPGKLEAAVQAAVSQYASEYYGLCIVALDGKGHEGFECSGRQNSGSAAPNSKTLFQIGSVTKTFTAALLAKRLEQGTVALSDHLDPLLPPSHQMGLTWDPITLRGLATHHSGLPENPPQLLGNQPGFTPAGGDYREFDLCLITPGCMGSGYQYSNFGFQILGNTLAFQDGYDHNAWYRDTYNALLHPLDMEDTGLFDDFILNDLGNFLIHAASGHSINAANHWVDETAAPHPRCPTANPSGCLYSTPHDMRVWLQYSMGLIIPGGTLGNGRDHWLRKDFDSTDSSATRVGLAWGFNEESNCEPLPKASGGHSHYTVVFKSGAVIGQHAFIGYLQDPNDPADVSPLGVVVLANSDNKGPDSVKDIGFNLLAALPFG